MLTALMLAAAAPTSAIDAERAFAADAQKLGEWTEFRGWAAPGALMFDPKTMRMVPAQKLLANRPDPPRSIDWWPVASWASCDGRTALNTGHWSGPNKRRGGPFITLWQRRNDGGWRWAANIGDMLETAPVRNGQAHARRASCAGKPRGAAMLGTSGASGHQSGHGKSFDGTLAWSWTVGPKGNRRFLAQLWTGQRFETIVNVSLG